MPSFETMRTSFLIRAVADLVPRYTPYGMSIESDIVERVNRAASRKQNPSSDTNQKRPKPLVRSVSERNSSVRQRPRGRLLDLSYPIKGRQCEAPLAGHDDGRRHHEWFRLSSHARAGRPKKPLAQSKPEDALSCGRRRR